MPRITSSTSASLRDRRLAGVGAARRRSGPARRRGGAGQSPARRWRPPPRPRRQPPGPAARARRVGLARRCSGPAARGTAAAARYGASAPPCAASVVSARLHRGLEDADIARRGRSPRGDSASLNSAKTSASARPGRCGQTAPTHLQVFRAPGPILFLAAKHLAGIGVARRAGAALHVHLHHRHGEIGAQHHLAPQGSCGDKARARISSPYRSSSVSAGCSRSASTGRRRRP